MTLVGCNEKMFNNGSLYNVVNLSEICFKFNFTYKFKGRVSMALSCLLRQIYSKLGTHYNQGFFKIILGNSAKGLKPYEGALWYSGERS